MCGVFFIFLFIYFIFFLIWCFPVLLLCGFASFRITWLERQTKLIAIQSFVYIQPLPANVHLTVLEEMVKSLDYPKAENTEFF